MWEEKENWSTNSKEVSTLLNSNAIERNKYYISSLNDVAEFLATHQLAFRGRVEAFSSMEDGGSGLFLSLLDFSIKKDPRLTEIVKTVPRNASSIVKEAIVQEVGDSWFTLKVDGTRDPTGVENIPIVLRFFDEDTKVVTERLLALATSSSCDAQALTEVICSELDAAGLATSKILSQVYDGAAVMSGKHGGVQRLLLEREGREIPYEHCLNHQLHLVVVHTLSEEQAYVRRLCKLARALVSLDIKSDTFLDAKAIQPLLDLTNSTIVDTECSVAKQYFATVTFGNDKKMTASRLISEHHGVLKAMPSVLHALKLSVTLGASTAMCENSFSALKNIFRESRRAMVHSRKVQLVQPAFERELTKKLSGEWKDKVLQNLVLLLADCSYSKSQTATL